MKQLKHILLIGLLLIATTVRAQYSKDLLGDDYVNRTINMPDDYQGKVTCTLIKKVDTLHTDKAILYIHGYNDYFFQSQLGDSVTKHGLNFYALDLRKYGRSYLPNQTRFYVKSLTEYFADIDTALSIIQSEGNKEIILMAHSTGGLITPLYLNARPQSEVKALILNSPFLDMNLGGFMESVMVPIVSMISPLFPNLVVSGAGKPGSASGYSQSLLQQYHGEWTYNTDWKLAASAPITAAWIGAIHKGQNTIHKGLKLNIPILVMYSDKSLEETEEWNEGFMHADIVLDVNDIQKYGKKLGDKVTLECIEGGMHDLILSPKQVRDDAFYRIFSFIDKSIVW